MQKRKLKMITVGTADITKKEVDAVMRVIKSTYITMGEKVKEFEERMAKAHGKKYGVMVNSGQAALEIALRCLIDAGKLKEGDKVAVPAITYISTFSAAVNVNLKPVLVDVRMDDFGMDFSKCPKVDAYMPVHLFGLAIRVPSRLKGPIVADACESILSPGIGKADLVCLSFFTSHSLCTGEGGMILTNNRQFSRILQSLRYHGRNLEAKEPFTYERIGYSSKPTELQAAIGLAQFNRRVELFSKRRRNGQYLTGLLMTIPEIQTPIIENNNFFMYPIVLKREGIRDKVVEYLNSKGIQTRMLLPLTNQEACINYVFERLGIVKFPTIMATKRELSIKFPIADYLNNNAFYVGCHTHLDLRDMKRIYLILKEAIEMAGKA